MKATREEILQILNGVPSEDVGFWAGLNETALSKKYYPAPEEAFGNIVPAWDLSAEARFKNEVRRDLLLVSDLYQCSPNQFLSVCSHPDVYEFRNFWRDSNRRQILRVIGLWERAVPLTPPFVQLMPHGTVVKVDGHHRLSVALRSKPTVLFFWSDTDLTRVGFSLLEKPAEL